MNLNVLNIFNKEWLKRKYPMTWLLMYPSRKNLTYSPEIPGPTPVRVRLIGLLSRIDRAYTVPVGWKNDDGQILGPFIFWYMVWFGLQGVGRIIESLQDLSTTPSWTIFSFLDLTFKKLNLRDMIIPWKNEPILEIAVMWWYCMSRDKHVNASLRWKW